MPVFALWSAPRARSTAFFRSMLERGDLLALHEPFGNLTCFGETDVDGRRFDSAGSLLAWLRRRWRSPASGPALDPEAARLDMRLARGPWSASPSGHA